MAISEPIRYPAGMRTNALTTANWQQGWFLDIYPHPEDGVVVWLVTRTGERLRLRQKFPVAFYAAGETKRLRSLWRFLQQVNLSLRLERVTRRDLFAGEIPVLQATVPAPARLPGICKRIEQVYPDLVYYDLDVPVPLRYAAAFGVFPLAQVRWWANADGWIQALEALESPWDTPAEYPPLRVLYLLPDANPVQRMPQALLVRYDRVKYEIPLKPTRAFLVACAALLHRYDPDLILTQSGDTWLFPYLLEKMAEPGMPVFNLNRDPEMEVERRKARSYFTYGQVIYRGQQVLLFGRAHIDAGNAVLFGDYDLDGVLEQARVTALPVQEAARKSPGAGITALQITRALQKGILVPYRKQEAERFKTAYQLIRADRGGLVAQPQVGVFTQVAEVDFVSMYPSIIVHFNISPETVGRGDGMQIIPELGIPIDVQRTGFVPETLAPLLARRVALRIRLAELHHRDFEYAVLKRRAQALKWLLVVCFGYLGYKNARFGRIESHEAVTAYGREAILRAKEAAEDQNYTVLHMYVDGMWAQRPGISHPQDVQPLLDEITDRTGLPIALEGIYRWVAFLPSRVNPKVPVANRYFGVFQDGTLKMRGIEARRHDTCLWVQEAQVDLIHLLARLPDIRAASEAQGEVLNLLRERLQMLLNQAVPLHQLVTRQTLSRAVEAYRSPSPAARAALQLQALGREMRPGQPIRFIYVLGGAGVHAWELPDRPALSQVDVAEYRKLLLRAAGTVLEPFGFEMQKVESCLSGGGVQLSMLPAQKPGLPSPLTLKPGLSLPRGKILP